MLLFAHTVLESAALSSAFVSTSLWLTIVEFLGGALQPLDPDSATIPVISGLSLGMFGITAGTWLGGAWLFKRPGGSGHQTYGQSLTTWGLRGWSWWIIPGMWWLLWTFSIRLAGEYSLSFLVGSCELWLSVAIAGWFATAWTMMAPAPVDVGSSGPDEPETITSRRRWWLPGTLLAAIVIYCVVFTGMNWGLWFNLRVPHGDSAMYEEHLWNLTHGKGFRSYLDQGTFLGEHIQVIHILLVPLHQIWPSQMLLELCETLALALGAIPVFLIARRHTGSNRIAHLLAVTYLLFFPVQFLDIAIDLKTFRPIVFGVPLLLWAIDRMERQRYVSMTTLLLLSLSAKEDYAIVICLLGVWLCVSSAFTGRSRHAFESTDGEQDTSGRRRPMIAGAVMAVLGGAYLLVAVKYAIPWFRDGDTVHYARYFEQFGETPGEILANMVLRPDLLLGELFTVASGLYLLRLLVPLAFLPLLSPGRLLVGIPLIVLLCLNEIAQSFPAPVHHFHAPLVPILFWACAAGLGHLNRFGGEAGRLAGRSSSALFAARLACACGLMTGLFWSLSPLGRQFWDEGSMTYWRNLYIPDERAQNFDRIATLIPETARVASTDFVHTRLTHCERSYDYSDYLRAVADFEDRVPHDTDYIVIDIEHPYNAPRKIAALRGSPHTEIRELIREPDRWELLPETGNGYFLVLKRRE